MRRSVRLTVPLCVCVRSPACVFKCVRLELKCFVCMCLCMPVCCIESQRNLSLRALSSWEDTQIHCFLPVRKTPVTRPASSLHPIYQLPASFCVCFKSCPLPSTPFGLCPGLRRDGCRLLSAGVCALCPKPHTPQLGAVQPYWECR